MKVLMLATYFPKPLNPLMGTWALAQAQALRRRGMEVEVVSFTAWVPGIAARTNGAKAYANCPSSYSWAGLNTWYPRWPVYALGPLRGWSERHPRLPMEIGWRTASGFLQRRVDNFKPDVIYAHHTAVNGFLASRLNQRHGLPFVVTDHDFGEIASCGDLPDRRAFFGPVMQRAAVVVAVAQRMETEMKRLFPAARTKTVQNGTDPIPQELTANPRPPELKDKTVIFSCGAFYERKGFPLLIDAFAEVSRKHPGCILRIAGDGQQRSQIVSRIRLHHLEGRVELLGFQPHQRVLQEMVWSDMFALVGWDEPFATVYSEAMSAGKPILCCSDGGINDVLQHGIQGLSVTPHDVGAAADALDILVGDPALRARMGNAARVLFENRLTWNHNAAVMESLFAEAIESKSRQVMETAQ